MKKTIFIILISVFILSLIIIVYAFPTIIEVTTPTGTTSNASINISYNFSQDDSLSPSNIKYSWNEINYTIYNSSLMLHMSFDNRTSLGEGNNNFSADSSQYNYSGNCSTGVSCNYTTGIYGNGIYFDGNTGTRIKGTTSLLANTPTQFTMCAWFKTNDKAKNAQMIVTISGNSDQGCELRFLDTSNKLYFITKNSSGQQAVTGYYTGTQNNVWEHACGVFNSTMISLYINGNLTSNVAHSTGQIQAYGGNLNIGSRSDLVTSLGVFNGTIDEVYIFNRSLSASEISLLYNSYLTKYDSQNWSLQVNQPLSKLNNSYYICDSNSTGSEICSTTRYLLQDTCTYLGSGNWNVNCSDNCSWSSNVIIPNNISFTGSGTLTLNANFSFNSSNQYIFHNSGCQLNTNNGAGFNR